MKLKKFMQKNRLWLFPALGVLLTGILCMAWISTRDPLVEGNPVRGVNPARSQIYVTGEQYSLNYEQEQEYQQEKEEKEVQIREEEKTEIQNEIESVPSEAEEQKAPAQTETDSSGAQTDTGSGQGSGANAETGTDTGIGKNDGSETVPDTSEETVPDEELPGGSDGELEGEDGTGGNVGGDEAESKKPLIECSLQNGQEISGSFFEFTVKATDYKKNVLSAFYIHVYLNGNVLTSSGTSNGNVSYIVDEENPPSDGGNEILVTVTDQEGNTASKTYTVMVNTQGEQKVGGELTITVEARTLGLGTFIHKTVEFYEGETIPYVLDRVILDSGYQYERDKSLRQGFYLKSINKPGITDGWAIPAPILEKLEEENASTMGYDSGRLAEKHFYENSGWMYMWNGEILESGMSAVRVEDGDEIVIFFTLDFGKEYNGVWFSGSW